MGQIPNIELIAVIVAAILGGLGWVFKMIYSAVKAAWKEIRSDITWIKEKLTDTEVDNATIKKDLESHGKQLIDHNGRIESLEHWTREATIEHKENHPKSKLQVI